LRTSRSDEKKGKQGQEGRKEGRVSELKEKINQMDACPIEIGQGMVRVTAVRVTL
jgi:hypothetical protein